MNSLTNDSEKIFIFFDGLLILLTIIAFVLIFFYTHIYNKNHQEISVVEMLKDKDLNEDQKKELNSEFADNCLRDDREFDEYI